jgi:DNA topoisomerase I
LPANYPTCNFAIWEKPVPDLCPNCGGLMVVPKPGQDPICYQEVIVPQRNAEERPQGDGAKKTTRKKTTTAQDGEKTTTTRRTTTRKKAEPAGEGANGTIAKARKTTTSKRATTRATSKTTRRVPATTGATRARSGTAAKKPSTGRNGSKGAQ